MWGNIRRKIATPRNVGFDGRGPTRERIERGCRVERVESGTRQTCLAITEKLKRSRQPLCFLVAADSFGTTIVSSFLVSSAIPLVSFEKRVHLSRLLQEIFVSTISDVLHLSTSRTLSNVFCTRYIQFFLSVSSEKKDYHLLAYSSSRSSNLTSKSIWDSYTGFSRGYSFATTSNSLLPNINLLKLPRV